MFFSHKLYKIIYFLKSRRTPTLHNLLSKHTLNFVDSTCCRLELLYEVHKINEWDKNGLLRPNIISRLQRLWCSWIKNGPKGYPRFNEN